MIYVSGHLKFSLCRHVTDFYKIMRLRTKLIHYFTLNVNYALFLSIFINILHMYSIFRVSRVPLVWQNCT
jgi:hypothetical protein